jgi:hypothetical protein
LLWLQTDSVNQILITMTQQDFLAEVINIYAKSRQVVLPSGLEITDKIRRGRNHTVSGMLEDLFACFLLKNFPSIDKIAIDQPLTIRQSAKKAKVLYPDLLLIQNDEIKAIVDIKTDMGRKREELENILISSSNNVITMQGKVMSYKDGITKQVFTITANQNLQSFIVVISRKNINPVTVEKHLANIQANKNIINARLYFLTDGIHPNHAVYRGQPENVRILSEFGELMKELQKIFRL